MRVFLRHVGAAVMVGVLVSGLAAGGCDPATRYSVLSAVFDNVPAPESTPRPRRPKHVRRVPAKKAKRVKTPKATPTPAPKRPPMEQATGWEAALRLVPKDTTGSPDWSAALKQGLIAPRVSAKPGGDPPEPLVLDVALAPAGDPPMRVVFPHAAHTEWLSCTGCHPDIFEMEAGAAKMTMADMTAGRYCGVCHGPVAFDMTRCGRCHPPLEELALDSALKGQMGVMFRHAPHTRWLPCESCHTKIFPMTAGATAMTMEDLSKGRYCGACHGTVAFAISECARCHPEMGQ